MREWSIWWTSSLEWIRLSNTTYESVNHLGWITSLEWIRLSYVKDKVNRKRIRLSRLFPSTQTHWKQLSHHYKQLYTITHYKLITSYKKSSTVMKIDELLPRKNLVKLVELLFLVSNPLTPVMNYEIPSAASMKELWAALFTEKQFRWGVRSTCAPSKRDRWPNQTKLWGFWEEERSHITISSLNPPNPPLLLITTQSWS